MSELISSIAIFVLLCGWSGPATAQCVRPAPKPRFALNVHVNPKLDDVTKIIHEKARDALNQANLGVPDDRIAYFRTVVSPQARVAEGWSGMVDSVKPVAGGAIVDLRIDTEQSGMANMSHINERYSVIGGKIRYLDAEIPRNTSKFQVGF